MEERHTDESDIDLGVILNGKKSDFRLHEIKSLIWDIDDKEGKGIEEYVKMDFLVYERDKVKESRLINTGAIDIKNTIYRRI